MSFNFPPDEALQRKAAAKLRGLLLEKPFMERWEPVTQEMKWVIGGRPNAAQHQKILPDYCYHIGAGKVQVQHRLALRLVAGVEQAARLGLVLGAQAGLLACGGVLAVIYVTTAEQGVFRFHGHGLKSCTRSGATY